MKCTVQEIRRRERGMTKTQLSHESKVPANIISWIEAGRFQPYPSQLERIAKALGVDEPVSLLEEKEVS